MLYCNYCKVHVRGNREKCQLCGNNLQGSADNENQEAYPDIPPAYEHHLAVRIMLFISIIALVASFAIYSIFPVDIKWPLFVVFGLLSMWATLIIIIRKMHNIPKTITWQVTILSALSLFWDWRTGWIGWSLDYVIPIACTAAMLVMYVTAKIMKLSIRDYILYSLLDGIFGVIPVLFILYKWVDIILPSIICAGLSIIFLSAIFIFQGENIKSELQKKMHI